MDQGTEMDDLYQELILDHNRRPRNFGTVDPATHRADGFNPLCGDKCTVSLQLDAGGTLQQICFCGEGCAISRASASLMTDAIKGKSQEDVEALFASFHALLAGETQDAMAPLGKLAAFGGVREYPMRVKCATLAWHTLQAALKNKPVPACTENDGATEAPEAPYV
jgi:nitrogen fixation NifU-like protein